MSDAPEKEEDQHKGRPHTYVKFKAEVDARMPNKHGMSEVLEDLMRGYVDEADNEEQSMPSECKEDSLHRAIKDVEEPPTTESTVPTIVLQLLSGELFVAQIALKSKSIRLYEYCRSKLNDPNMELSDFVNAVIINFFEERGIRVVYHMDI